MGADREDANVAEEPQEAPSPLSFFSFFFLSFFFLLGLVDDDDDDAGSPFLCFSFLLFVAFFSARLAVLPRSVTTPADDEERNDLDSTADIAKL